MLITIPGVSFLSSTTDPVTKRNNFYFSLFKGRGTQSHFLKAFYDLMKILYNWQVFMILKFYTWPSYSAKLYKYVTKIWIYVTNMCKIDDFYLIFTTVYSFTINLSLWNCPFKTQNVTDMEYLWSYWTRRSWKRLNSRKMLELAIAHI